MVADIVERLREPVIADAFAEGVITSGILCERLIRERHDAADEIERLRSYITEKAVEANPVVSEAIRSKDAETARLREEVEAIRLIAAKAHRHRANIGKESMFLAAIEGRAAAAVDSDGDG